MKALEIEDEQQINEISSNITYTAITCYYNL